MGAGTRFRVRFSATVLALTCAVFAVFSVQGRDWWPFGRDNRDVKVVVDDSPLAPAVREATSFADVIQEASASVVNVVSTYEVERDHPYADEPFFRFFAPQMPRAPRQQRPGVGSGVIIASEGYVITNAHVVENATDVKVVLPDKKGDLDAEVIGSDSKTDIAVLKILTENGLPAITLGDSETLRVGDTVLAIGNPFGVGQTVTRGIVSAMGRGIGINDYEDFIQTDASINPGNSGGALIDAQGRLVGINTAILSRSGGNQGVGFAVPINMARNIVQQLLQHGTVSRGFLGVSIQDIDPEMADYFDLDPGKGVLITDVSAESAAKEAGVKAEDVVLQYEGEEVNSARDLRLLVAGTLPGTKVELVVLRDGKLKTLDVTLKQLPGSELARSGHSRHDEVRNVLRGIAVEDVSPRLRQQFDIAPDLRGAVVISIESSSPAANSHLSVGDVIVQINRDSVASADEAIEASRRLKGESAMLKIVSRGRTFFAVVRE